jgi:(heptosyl)LPS beta-1,4-glucosyltransferase
VSNPRAPLPRPWRREDKLLCLAYGLFASLEAIGAGGTVAQRLARAAVWGLAMAVHAWLSGRDPSAWRRHRALGFLPAAVAAAAGLTGALVAALALGPPGPGDLARAWRQGGAPGLVVLVIVLGVPARRFAAAVRHRHGPVRDAALAGTVLVAGCAIVACFRPLLTQPAGATVYVVSLAVLYGLLRQREDAWLSVPIARAQTLSVTIIARNEADRIGRCLESVAGWADEIVVLDSGSTDGTVEVCRRFTDRVVVTDWPGYGPQKQRALEMATGAWVLSIDADEALTPELRHDIDAALSVEPDCVAYRLPWGVVVHGKLLDFGRSARAPLRLFRREGTRFTDAQVHETVELPPGRVGRLRGRLLHYTQRDFGHALDKMAKYAWLGAQQRHAQGRRAGGVAGALVRGLIVFLQVYVVRLGFLDGQPGLVVAVHYAEVAFNKYAGVWALRRERRP